MAEWQRPTAGAFTCVTPSAAAPGRASAAPASRPTAASAAARSRASRSTAAPARTARRSSTWLEGGEKATEAVQERLSAGPTFGELAHRWRDGRAERLDRQAPRPRAVLADDVAALPPFARLHAATGPL